MPREIVATVYKYDELNAKAKEKARQWFAELESQGFDIDYEDFETCASCLGIELDTHDVGLIGGRKRKEPCIYWSGFSNQGDGACFEGTYKAKDGGTAEQAILAHAPQDLELINIARGLDSLQAKHDNRLVAKVKNKGRGSAHYNTDIDVWFDHSDNGLECLAWEHEPNGPEDAKALTELLHRFMIWMYQQMEAEYEYRMSDEAVEESIRCNDYEFTADGKRSLVIA